MPTMVDKALTAANDAIWPALALAYKQQYGHDVKTRWDMLQGALGVYVTERKDGVFFTNEQKAWIEAWVEGWNACQGFINKHQLEEQKLRRRVYR